MILPEAIPSPFAFLYEKVVARRRLAAQYKRIASGVVLARGFVVDIGTGPGHLAIELASRNEALHVLGIDLSAAMIARAKKNAVHIPNAEFRVMNARHLLLPDNCADLILSTASMHHWRDPELVFLEIYRVLKPCGRALIYEIRSDAPRHKMFAEIPRNLLFPARFIVPWAFRLHGVTRNSLDTKILPLIKKTPFHEARLETVGMWYCLLLVKK